jgi:serine/threonine protein kinase
MELASDGHLYEYMKGEGANGGGCRFGEDCIGFLVREVLMGVQFMHEKQVIHRDVKPENIVLVHVNMWIFRECRRYVILVGRYTAPSNSGPPYAVHPSTYPHKY